MATVTPDPVLDTRSEDQMTAEAIGSLPIELSDRSNANPAVVLIEAVGAMVGKTQYQINRFPSAVIQKCLALCGVTVDDATAATTTQSFTLSFPQQNDTVIPFGTQVSTVDGSVAFSTLSDLTIPAYTTPAGTVSITSGSTTVTGSGTTFVTGSTWVGWQIQIPATSGNWYTIANVVSTTSLTLSSSATATTSGAAWNVGAVSGSVQAQATTTGTDTNVAAGKLTSLNSAPSGVASTTNAAAASGGADAETDTAAVDSAADAFATRDMAVTENDYARFAAKALGDGGRAKARANYNDSTVALGYVSVAMLSPAWTTSAPVSTAERAATMRDLATRTFVGSTTVDFPATITTLTPTILFWRKASYSAAQVKANIAGKVNSLLSPNTYPWGRTIYTPDQVQAAESADGVDRVESIGGVPCLTAGATTTTPNAVTLTNGSTSATGTAGDFTSMNPGRAILIDAVNSAAYLVTGVSSGTLTITPAFAGATRTATIAWFNAGDTTLTDWKTLPYSSLSTSISSPAATLICVGSVT